MQNVTQQNTPAIARKSTAAKRAVKILFGILLLSAVVALLAVMFGQWLPEGGTINMGNETIVLGEGASLGAGAGFVAWAAVTVGLFVAFFAVLFALLVTALVLLVTAVMLVFTVLALLSPIIVLAGLVYWAMRALKRSKAQQRVDAVPANNAAPTPI